jgi:hypothetical protein
MNREADELIELDELADALRAREGSPRPQPVQGSNSALRRGMVIAVLAAAVVTGVAFAVFTRGGDRAPSSSGAREQTLPSSGGSGSASCAAAVEWHGTTYIGSKVQGPVKLAGSLGDGTFPPCNDTGGGGSGTTARSVPLVALEGLSSEDAVAVAGEPSTVYISPGSFPQVPHTALHDLVYGPSPAVPNERGECTSGHTSIADVRAVVRAASFGMLSVTLLEPTELPRENWIFPDARTVITGGGTKPHVQPGDVVQARVLVCRHANDPHFLKLVAIRLTLPSPNN